MKPEMENASKPLASPQHELLSSSLLRQEWMALESEAAQEREKNMMHASASDANAISRMEIMLLEEELAVTLEAIAYLKHTAEYAQRKPTLHLSKRQEM